MATKKKLTDVKLQLRVEDTDDSGKATVKNLNFSKIKLDATDEALLTAAQAIAALQTRSLSSVRSIVTGDLMEE